MPAIRTWASGYLAPSKGPRHRVHLMLSYDEGRRPLVERELEDDQADILVDASSRRTRPDDRPPLNCFEQQNGKPPD